VKASSSIVIAALLAAACGDPGPAPTPAGSTIITWNRGAAVLSGNSILGDNVGPASRRDFAVELTPESGDGRATVEVRVETGEASVRWSQPPTDPIRNQLQIVRFIQVKVRDAGGYTVSGTCDATMNGPHSGHERALIARCRITLQKGDTSQSFALVAWGDTGALEDARGGTQGTSAPTAPRAGIRITPLSR
jgi:hypothetical protein